MLPVQRRSTWPIWVYYLLMYSALFKGANASSKDNCSLLEERDYGSDSDD